MSGSAIAIGAGLAGLSAAAELGATGSDVIVVEARDRVGGRTWSRRLPNGATVEMGAEFVLPGNTEVLALAERLGLGFWDKGMRYGDREPRGGIGTDRDSIAAAVAVVERALESLEGRPMVPRGARLAGARARGPGGDPRARRDLLGERRRRDPGDRPRRSRPHRRRPVAERGRR